MQRILKNLAMLLIISASAGISCHRAVSEIPVDWPPQLGKTYPNVPLLDQNGQEFDLSKFRGKVVVVEPIGMNCPACQSYSGAMKVGRFEMPPDPSDKEPGAKTFEQWFFEYTHGTKLSDSRIVFVQLLLYNMRMQSPTVDDAKRWYQHFQPAGEVQRIVVVPRSDIRGTGSYNMIPGFHLIDKKGILRFDASGHSPKNNLWSQLLPAVPKIIAE